MERLWRPTDVYYVAGGIGVDSPFLTNGETLDPTLKQLDMLVKKLKKEHKNANARTCLKKNRMFIAYETAKWAKRQIITQTKSPLLVLLLMKLNLKDWQDML